MSDHASKIKDIIEKELGVEREKLRTVGDAVAYLEAKVAG